MTTKKINKTDLNKQLLSAASNNELGRALHLIEQGADATYGFRGKYVLNELFFEAPLEYLEKVFSYINTKIKARKGIFDNVVSYFRPANEQLKIIEMLLEKDAPVDSDDLAFSVINSLKGFPSGTDNHLEETLKIAEGPLRKLLELGMNPDFVEPKDDKETLLFLSVYAHAPAMVRVLIEYGADPDLTTGRGLTPLMMACGSVYNYDEIWSNSKSKQEIALYLLKSGADIGIKSKSKRTALTYAKSSDNWRIVNLLSAVEKTGDIPDALPDEEDEEKIKEDIEAFEEETRNLVKELKIDDEWPITDKDWIKKRQAVWKYVQNNIEKFSHHNTKRKDFPALKKYYVYGESISDKGIRLSSIYQVWFHISNDAGLLKNIIYDQKGDHYNKVSHVFYRANPNEFELPYGLFGPRSAIIYRVFAEVCFPIENNSYQAASSLRAAEFINIFCRNVSGFISRENGDPYHWVQYLLDYMVDCVDYVYSKDVRDILSINSQQLLASVKAFNPEKLRKYKRASADKFVSELTVRLNDGLYQRLTYNGLTDVDNKDIVIGKMIISHPLPFGIGDMYTARLDSGVFEKQAYIRIFVDNEYHGKMYICTLHPNQYVIRKNQDDYRIGFKTVLSGQYGNVIIEVISTNAFPVSTTGSDIDEEFCTLVTDKIQSLERIREKQSKNVRISFSEANAAYFVHRSYQRAFELFTELSDLGYTYGSYGLALMYEQGNYVEEDKEKARQIYLECAQKGLKDAKCRLAFLLASLVDDDYGEAIKWIISAEYNVAPEVGDVSGYDLESFLGKYPAAYDWLNKAVQEGDAKCTYYLGLVYKSRNQEEKANELMAKAAADGWQDAIFARTKIQLTRRNLGKEDIENIQRAIRLIADAGHKDAIALLANFERINNNAASSIEHYVAAAKKGVMTAVQMIVRGLLPNYTDREHIVQGMAWLIVAYYINQFDTVRLIGSRHEYHEYRVSKSDQLRAIQLADEYMEEFLVPNCVKDENWVYKK